MSGSRVLLVCVAAVAVGTLAVSHSSDAGGDATRLDPMLFAKLASGVVEIEGFDCSGAARIQGTGFLVGSDVVMTARHVVDPGGKEANLACSIKVRLDGHWIAATQTWWYKTSDPTGRDTDLATVRLAEPAKAGDHIFHFADFPALAGADLAMIGYPLGGGISLTQGQLLKRTQLGHVPLIIVRLLGGAGASGSPLVDNSGKVTGVLQLGLGAKKDVLGQRTAGVVAGIDLPTWWGSGGAVEHALCQAYPKGGVPACSGDVTFSFVGISGNRTEEIAWSGNKELISATSGQFILERPDLNRVYVCAPSLQALEAGKPSYHPVKVCAQYKATGTNNGIADVQFEEGLFFDPLSTADIAHRHSTMHQTYAGIPSDCYGGDDTYYKGRTDQLCVASDGEYLTYMSYPNAHWTAIKSQPVDPKRLKLPDGVRILSLGASAKINP